MGESMLLGLLSLVREDDAAILRHFGDGAGRVGCSLGRAFELGEEDACEDESGAREGAAAETLIDKDVRSDRRKDGLKAEDDGGVSRRGELLGPNLDGEGNGGSKHGGDGDGKEELG